MSDLQKILMSTKVIWIVLVCLTLLGGTATGVFASVLQEANDLIATKQVPQIELAIANLEEYLNQNPDDGEALWIIGKAHLYLGDRIGDEDTLAVFQTGQDYADQAVELAPNSPDAH